MPKGFIDRDRLRQCLEPVAVYESRAEGYFLDAGDLQPLAVLDGLHELGGVEEIAFRKGFIDRDRRESNFSQCPRGPAPG